MGVDLGSWTHANLEQDTSLDPAIPDGTFKDGETNLTRHQRSTSSQAFMIDRHR